MSIPRTMPAIWYERQGPAREVLVVGEMATPEPGHGEVLVRVMASGVNPHDTKGRSGWTKRPMPAPRIVPHSDGAGVIAAVGAGVAESRIGERVWLFRADHRHGMGAAAGYCVVAAEHAVHLPETVSLAAGAGLGVPALTAHKALFAAGPVTGLDVLVAGGAGAVAAYAIQLARWNGARVIATVSSPEKAGIARGFDADETIDYRTEDVAARVLALTGGKGVERIVEVDLGANLAADIAMIARHGWICSYSSSRVREPVLPYYELAPKDVTLRIVQGQTFQHAERVAAFRTLATLMERGALRHPATLAFAFADVASAHEAMESGTVIGKIVVEGPAG